MPNTVVMKREDRVLFRTKTLEVRKPLKGQDIRELQQLMAPVKSNIQPREKWTMEAKHTEMEAKHTESKTKDVFFLIYVVKLEV